MPLIEVSNDNLSRLDAIRNAKGLSLKDALREALDAAQFNELDENTKATILNAPQTYAKLMVWAGSWSNPKRAVEIAIEQNENTQTTNYVTSRHQKCHKSLITTKFHLMCPSQFAKS